MKPDISKTISERILLLDSAMGSMLFNKGLKNDFKAGELWNVEEDGKQKVFEVHQANVEAGSDLIITNTFGANRFKLGLYAAADRVHALNSAGAQLAREAAGEKVYVAGDIGPTGEILEQWGGEKSADEIRGAFDSLRTRAPSWCAVRRLGSIDFTHSPLI